MTTFINARTSLSDDTRAMAYKLYDGLFSPINELAAQRHLMTEVEFGEVAYDERVTKYLAYDDRVIGEDLTGMSVMTNDLDAWPLISPPYFRRHYPRLYEARQIWYVGFVGAARPGVFDALVAEMFPRTAAGMVCMDFCALRQQQGLQDTTLRMLRRLAGESWMLKLDDQATYAYRYDGPF
jgi:hypothetical protein